MCCPMSFLQTAKSKAGFRFTIRSVSFQVEIGINEPAGPSQIVKGPGGGKLRLASSVGVSPSSLPQCPGSVQGCFSMAPVASFGWAPQSCKADLKVAIFVVCSSLSRCICSDKDPASTFVTGSWTSCNCNLGDVVVAIWLCCRCCMCDVACCLSGMSTFWEAHASKF